MSDSNEEDRAFLDMPNWLAFRMVRNSHLYNKLGGTMPPEKEHEPVICTEAHQWPACEDPNCIFRGIPGAALENGFQRAMNLSLLNDELEYLTRLVHVDQQRMLQDREHAVAYGARNYENPPAMGLAEKLLHSFSMSRTAAVLAEIEDMEKARQDKPL